MDLSLELESLENMNQRAVLKIYFFLNYHWIRQVVLGFIIQRIYFSLGQMANLPLLLVAL